MDVEELGLLLDTSPPSAVILADEAPPVDKQAPQTPAAYAPCARCGVLVLSGTIDAGEVVALDPSQRTYVVVWPNKAQQPDLKASGAYPVHQCAAGAGLHAR